MAVKMWENKYQTTIICVDSYDNSVPVGRFYNQFYQDGIQFHGAIDLLKKIEAILDEKAFPQAFTAIRSFAEKPNVNLTRENNKDSYKGKAATFALKVLFRQNTSWQGIISWVEGNREETFRSVLEMLLLIDSAIRTEGT